MSNLSKIFQKVPVEVQNRSGFDQSHEHLFTAKVGTLVPALCKEIIPNTTIDLGVFSQVQLPPMATDFYGRVDACLEAFFVPMRQLFGGFEDALTYYSGGLDASQSFGPSGVVNPTYMPGAINVPLSAITAGSLADYLGCKLVPGTGQTLASTINLNNILPLVCYHWVFHEFYRDSRIQREFLFKRSTSSLSGASSVNAISQILGLYGQPNGTKLNFDYVPPTGQTSSSLDFVDGVNLFSLRQRNYAKDYFTNATTSPQQGSPSVLSFAVSGGTGSFTIASLMQANSLQRWLQLNNLAGNRFGEQQKAQYGVYPESFKCDRPIYLGSTRFPIYNKSVYQTGNDQLNSIQGIQNPFNNSVGAKYGSPLGVGDGSLVDGFHATEHGFLMVMFSIVPHAVYSTGVDAMFRRYRSGDYAIPLLQNIGDEPIMADELNELATVFGTTNVFGYTQRFARYKYENDKVSGLLRDGESLDCFALKRTITGAASVQSSSFIEIPTNALDEVAASADNLPSSYGGWCDCFFKLKTIIPLAAYSIPTLGDLKDTHTEMIANGGTRL